MWGSKKSIKGARLDLGFTPLELECLLGKKECKIRIPFKEGTKIKYLKLKEFESHFNVIYRPYLTINSYDELKEIIQLCPYFFKWEKFFFSQETEYLEKVNQGFFEDAYIQWINSPKGYGLFAHRNIPKGAFVGEYSGILRKIDVAHPDFNDYCFQYPTKIFSKKYYMIDPYLEGNLARFINHSDTPNLDRMWLMDRGLLHLVLFANQNISEGTELTFDYGKDYWLHRKKVT